MKKVVKHIMQPSEKNRTGKNKILIEIFIVKTELKITTGEIININNFATVSFLIFRYLPAT